MSVQVFKDGQSEWIPNEQFDRYLTLGYTYDDPNPVKIKREPIEYSVPVVPLAPETEISVLNDMGIYPIEIVHPNPS